MTHFTILNTLLTQGYIMLVADIIKELQTNFKNDDELVIAWWGKTSFEEIPQEHWEAFVNHVENKMDWSPAHEDIAAQYDNNDY